MARSGFRTSLVFAAIGLGGCTAQPQLDVYAVKFGKQDLFFADRALQAAVDSFLDIPAGTPSSSVAGVPSDSGPADTASDDTEDSDGFFSGGFSDGGFFGGGSADEDGDEDGAGGFTGTFSLPGTGDILDGLPEYREEHSAERGVGLAAIWNTGRRTQPLVRVETGTGTSTYDLPDGAGILSDPIRITADTTYYQGEVGLRHVVPLANWLSAEMEATVGARSVQNRLKVKSALLDIEDDYDTTRGFAGVAGSVTIAPPALKGAYLALEARGRAYDRTTGSGQAGAKIGYRRAF